MRFQKMTYKTDPKGQCYELAGKYVLDTNREATLVHGRPTLQRPPYEKYGHAWIEEDDEVYDPCADVRMSRQVYYAIGNIDEDETREYSHEDLVDKINEFGHWGPWEGPDAVPPIDD
jgi:hypothetical protein